MWERDSPEPHTCMLSRTCNPVPGVAKMVKTTEQKLQRRIFRTTKQSCPRYVEAPFCHLPFCPRVSGARRPRQLASAPRNLCGTLVSDEGAARCSLRRPWPHRHQPWLPPSSRCVSNFAAFRRVRSGDFVASPCGSRVVLPPSIAVLDGGSVTSRSCCCSRSRALRKLCLGCEFTALRSSPLSKGAYAGAIGAYRAAHSGRADKPKCVAGREEPPGRRQHNCSGQWPAVTVAQWPDRRRLSESTFVFRTTDRPPVLLLSHRCHRAYWWPTLVSPLNFLSLLLVLPFFALDLSAQTTRRSATSRHCLNLA